MSQLEFFVQALLDADSKAALAFCGEHSFRNRNMEDDKPRPVFDLPADGSRQNASKKPAEPEFGPVKILEAMKVAADKVLNRGEGSMKEVNESETCEPQEAVGKILLDYVLAKRQLGCAANEQEFIERLPESDRAWAGELLETAELLFEAYGVESQKHDE